MSNNAASSKFDLVLFDCDGTLVDSEVIAADAWSQHVARYGVTLTAQQALQQFRGASMSLCLARIAELHGAALPSDFEQELRMLMSEMLSTRLQPINGALDMIRVLSVSFCLASNAPRDKIELCLKVTGMLPYFAGRIFSAYDIQKWKPDPALFLHAAASLGAMPQRCAVVEDSLPGIQAGLAAGMTVFALQSKGHLLDLPDGVHVIRELAELPTRLQSAP